VSAQQTEGRRKQQNVPFIIVVNFDFVGDTLVMGVLGQILERLVHEVMGGFRFLDIYVLCAPIDI
jgi:hypothetical protein